MPVPMSWEAIIDLAVDELELWKLLDTFGDSKFSPHFFFSFAVKFLISDRHNFYLLQIFSHFIFLEFEKRMLADGLDVVCLCQNSCKNLILSVSVVGGGA